MPLILMTMSHRNKALPDFSNRKSDNDSVASGDNSEGWDEQEALVKIARKVGIAQSGSKRKVFDRLRDSEYVVKIDDDSFEYCHEIVKGKEVPTWVIFTPEPMPAVLGIDMSTGAQRGYYGQRNKDNSIRGVCHTTSSPQMARESSTHCLSQRRSEQRSSPWLMNMLDLTGKSTCRDRRQTDGSELPESRGERKYRKRK